MRLYSSCALPSSSLPPPLRPHHHLPLSLPALIDCHHLPLPAAPVDCRRLPPPAKLPLGAAAGVMDYAVPYLRCRAAGMVPALFVLMSFAAYQGLLNTVMPLRVSLTTNLLNLALDHLFIFGLGRGGAATPSLSLPLLLLSWCIVPSFLSNGSAPSGAAAATPVVELASAPCVAS